MMLDCVLVVVFLHASIFIIIESREAGFKTIVTEKGLDFLSKNTENAILPNDYSQHSNITEEINQKKFKIFDLSFEFLRYKFSQVDNRLTSTLKFRPNVGLEHKIQNMNLTVDAKYYTKNNVSGYMSMIMRKISLSSVIRPINDDGQLKFLIDECRTTIKSLNLEFVEGSSNVVFLLKRIVDSGDDLKTVLQDELCRLENSSFVETLSQTFANLTTNEVLFDNYMFDESLLADPSVEDSYLETRHHGTTGIINEGSVPFQPPEISFVNFNNTYDLKMVYVFMSNYSLNSLMYYLWESDALSYNISKNATENSVQADYLRTDCGEDGLCAAILLPSLREKFPNGSLAVLMKALDRPKVDIRTGNITVTTKGYIECFVEMPNGSKPFLFSSNIDLIVVIKKFQLSDYSSDIRIEEFKLTNFTSSQPEVDSRTISLLLNLAKDVFFEANLSDLFKKAIVIPKILNFDIDVNDSEVLFVEDLIYISLNFCDSSCQKQS